MTGFVIRFVVDESAYGINGRPPCTSDNIEFFDGLAGNAESMHKLCRFENPGPFFTSSQQARVVFTGTINRNRPQSRVGVKIHYSITDQSMHALISFA